MSKEIMLGLECNSPRFFIDSLRALSGVHECIVDSKLGDALYNFERESPKDVTGLPILTASDVPCFPADVVAMAYDKDGGIVAAFKYNNRSV